MTQVNGIHDRGEFPQYFNEEYDVLGVLGRGGMGFVYKAVHKSLNREVALKVLDAAVGEEAAKRFHLEAQAMKKLDHQNIVQVFDFGREGEQFFIAMTYVPGITLGELLRKRERLEPEEAVLISRQVARGLLYAHNKGIVHRDIKPSNIMITTDNRVYITDFGISHIQDLDRLTSTGMAMGTPEYMSPEQCQGESVTVHSDIYGLGIILYEMLCGDPPFTGNKPLAIAYKQVHEDPALPSTIRPDISPGLENLIMRCLRKNRSERFIDANAFLEELDQVASPVASSQNQGASAKPQSGTRKISSLLQRKSKSEILVRLLYALAAVLALLVVLLIAMSLLGQSHTQSLSLLRELQWKGSYETRNLETDAVEGYPTRHLSDENLATAWILPQPASLQNPILSVEFAQPTLITAIGMAIGYQKSMDDQFQDRFGTFSKPKVMFLRTKEGLVRRLDLQNVKGMQYLSLHPLETMGFSLDLRESYSVGPEAAIAISEIRLIGMPISQP